MLAIIFMTMPTIKLIVVMLILALSVHVIAHEAAHGLTALACGLTVDGFGLVVMCRRLGLEWGGKPAKKFRCVYNLCECSDFKVYVSVPELLGAPPRVQLAVAVAGMVANVLLGIAASVLLIIFWGRMVFSNFLMVLVLAPDNLYPLLFVALVIVGLVSAVVSLLDTDGEKLRMALNARKASRER